MTGNIPKGVYRHYKGNRYHVLEMGTHTETGEQLVIYQSISDKKVWVRPLSMFTETVEVNGQTILRFEKID